MQHQIIELFQNKVSVRKIASSLGVSRNTVRKAIKALEPNQEGAAEVLPLPDTTKSRPWLELINRDELLEKRKQGRTLKVLYEHYEPPVSYSAFRKAVNSLCSQKKITTIKLVHNPGEKTFIDYCDGVFIYDRKTGEKKQTQFFCGVLPFSSLTYGEFVFNQKLESFISSQEKMWAYFGGVTPYVVVDNLKSGVLKAHQFDPDVNPTYCEYANSRKFAVLPARPYTPRDKASIEAAIGVIQRGFFNLVADTKFYDLSELNQAFREYLDKMNLSIMKDYGVSRRQRFEEEKANLLPISCEPYEISQWKEVTVHPDCHVQVLHNFYSAPHIHVGRKLRARIREKTVELFTPCGEGVSAHLRLAGKGKNSTCDSHYPESKKQYLSFDVKSNLARAEAIGPKTFELVRLLFNQDRPLKYLRPVQGIIRLAKYKKFTIEALEYAASQALTFRKYRLAYISSCAQHFTSNPTRILLAPPQRDPSEIYLHNYFSGEQ